jgi:hypothetical protein
MQRLNWNAGGLVERPKRTRRAADDSSSPRQVIRGYPPPQRCAMCPPSTADIQGKGIEQAASRSSSVVRNSDVIHPTLCDVLLWSRVFRCAKAMSCASVFVPPVDRRHRRVRQQRNSNNGTRCGHNSAALRRPSGIRSARTKNYLMHRCWMPLGAVTSDSYGNPGHDVFRSRIDQCCFRVLGNGRVSELRPVPKCSDRYFPTVVWPGLAEH